MRTLVLLYQWSSITRRVFPTFSLHLVGPCWCPLVWMTIALLQYITHVPQLLSARGRRVEVSAWETVDSKEFLQLKLINDISFSAQSSKNAQIRKSYPCHISLLIKYIVVLTLDSLPVTSREGIKGNVTIITIHTLTSGKSPIPQVFLIFFNLTLS